MSVFDQEPFDYHDRSSTARPQGFFLPSEGRSIVGSSDKSAPSEAVSVLPGSPRTLDENTGTDHLARPQTVPSSERLRIQALVSGAIHQARLRTKHRIDSYPELDEPQRPGSGC